MIEFLTAGNVWTMQQVSNHFTVTPQTIRAWCKRYDITPGRLGKECVFTEAQVKELEGHVLSQNQATGY